MWMPTFSRASSSVVDRDGLLGAVEHRQSRICALTGTNPALNLALEELPEPIVVRFEKSRRKHVATAVSGASIPIDDDLHVDILEHASPKLTLASLFCGRELRAQ